MKMRVWLVGLALVVGISGVWAQEAADKQAQAKPAAPKATGVKPCDELKQEIDAKLQAKGVKGYTLDIIAASEVKDQKIIGSCDGGTKKIAYERK